MEFKDSTIQPKEIYSNSEKPFELKEKKFDVTNEGADIAFDIDCGYHKKDNDRKDCCFCFEPCCNNKTVCKNDRIQEPMKILKVKLNLQDLCPNRKVAFVLQLINCKNDAIIAQKGKTFLTGRLEDCSNYYTEEILFALPYSMCKKSDEMKIVCTSNYIGGFCFEDCDCHNS